MDMQKNAFKAALKTGKPLIGYWCSLVSPVATEIAADAGFDWILLDCEHSPADVPEILSQLQASQGSKTSCIVRAAWNDAVMFKRLLDIGAQTLLVPYVQNEDEAKKAVAATRYPPQGIRGVTGAGRASRFGRMKTYLKEANTETCVLVQVETRDALTKIDAIARVDGVDGVFIGPSDLAASMGHIGNPAHPEVQDAIKHAAQALKKAGKPAGILSTNDEDTKRYLEWGFTFIAAGIDVLLLTRGTDALVKTFKS